MFIINKITFFFLRTIKIFLNSVLIKYLFLSSFIANRATSVLRGIICTRQTENHPCLCLAKSKLSSISVGLGELAGEGRRPDKRTLRQVSSDMVNQSRCSLGWAEFATRTTQWPKHIPPHRTTIQYVRAKELNYRLDNGPRNIWELIINTKCSCFVYFQKVYLKSLKCCVGAKYLCLI